MLTAALPALYQHPLLFLTLFHPLAHSRLHCFPRSLSPALSSTHSPHFIYFIRAGPEIELKALEETRKQLLGIFSVLSKETGLDYTSDIPVMEGKLGKLIQHKAFEYTMALLCLVYQIVLYSLLSFDIDLTVINIIITVAFVFEQVSKMIAMKSESILASCRLYSL